MLLLAYLYECTIRGIALPLVLAAAVMSVLAKCKSFYIEDFLCDG